MGEFSRLLLLATIDFLSTLTDLFLSSIRDIVCPSCSITNALCSSVKRRFFYSTYNFEDKNLRRAFFDGSISSLIVCLGYLLAALRIAMLGTSTPNCPIRSTITSDRCSYTSRYLTSSFSGSCSWILTAYFVFLCSERLLILSESLSIALFLPSISYFYSSLPILSRWICFCASSSSYLN